MDSNVKWWQLVIVISLIMGVVALVNARVNAMPDRLDSRIESADERLEQLDLRIESLNGFLDRVERILQHVQVGAVAEGGHATVFVLPDSVATQLLREERRREWEEDVDARLRPTVD